MINVCIIGLGQIGGSLGLALKKYAGKRYHVTGIARRQETEKTALKMKAVDEVSLSFEASRPADIIVICIPVDAIAEMYKRISVTAKKNAVVTDVGSVKSAVEKPIKLQGAKLAFVGAHPMAGKENNGILSADKDMFKNANVVITGNNNKAAEKKVADMWKATGAKIIKMNAATHDNLAAVTSHLPHVIAFSLNKVYKDVKKKNKEIDLIAASSFKSATRVANSSADMWAPVLSANSENVIKHLNAFIKELNSFKKVLKNKSRVKKEILKTQK